MDKCSLKMLIFGDYIVIVTSDSPAYSCTHLTAYILFLKYK